MCSHTYSHELKYQDFLELVKKSDFEKTVQQEHEEILRKKVDGKFTEARKKENLPLNRYGYLPCFDHSRVVLPVEKKRSDFFNGNYVDGFDQTNKFILTQAPLLHTMYDFWRTIWMHHCRIIVMLCEKTIFNRNDKYDAYWCYQEGYLKCMKFKITTTKVEVQSNYVKTTLEVTDGTKATQEVLHFVFTTWPDSKLPVSAEDFLDFILTVRRNYDEIKAQLTQKPCKFPDPPIVVHSKRGIGRSSTFCALFIEISRFNKTRMVSLASTVSQIRTERYNALSNFSYYFFCYQVLACYVSIVGQGRNKLRGLIVFYRLPLFKKWAVPNFFTLYNS
ncbi:tyrosine-protein phosphatase non-receptor type 9-like [Cydia pomonella]|uniref:tyrosine-protein phosphatase non-receptor type 9-like n=1 Tax=Cydia pomonella TaxID=82600 RepID=UPI002ADE91B6|nr:tyrosine-protein phosphatase non-receptor type 9-like [Cydia pomonella]